MNARYVETIVWVPLAVELPDEEMTVLVLLPDGEVRGCHLLAGRWRQPGGKTPVAWANWPTGEPDQRELFAERSTKVAAVERQVMELMENDQGAGTADSKS